MGKTRLTGSGVFSQRGGEFSEFLSEVGQDSANGDRRFLGRNFLLDEGVLDPRADSYEAEGGATRHADLHAWQDRHEHYLERRVSLEPSASGPPGTLNPAHPKACPETFLLPDAFTFAEAQLDIDLLRVVPARRVATFAGVPESDLLAWGREVVASKDAGSVAWQELARHLGFWSSRLRLSPVYSTFWEDQRDLFEPERPDWADALRDRLGLVHLSPPLRGEIPIFVFRYPVRAVPKHVQVRHGRPLAAPTVLDGALFEAFCPAPKGQTCGRVVDLSTLIDEPSREVVHPFFPYRVEHLFRVGSVQRPLPPSLSDARTGHLLMIQDLCSRPDYGVGTDGDLLT